MAFPFALKRPRHPLGYLLLWAPYIAAYQWSSRFPPVEPVTLSWSALDRAIPFVPELLPVYVAFLPLYWWTAVRSRSDHELTRLWWAAHFQMAVCLPVFLFFPVQMPRELFYGAASHGWADLFWRWFDGPGNCLPSLHAAGGALLIHFNRSRPAPRLHALAGVAVIASTVFVKQHYAVDLLAGIVVFGLTLAFLAVLDPEPAPAQSASSASSARMRRRYSP